MKAYLIDPFEKKISVVEYSGDFKQIYEHIKADMFECCHFTEHDDVWVDEEGLLKDLKEQKFFLIKGYPQPLAGRGLVLGTDGQGESIEPKISEQDLADKVAFMDLHDVRCWIATNPHSKLSGA